MVVKDGIFKAYDIRGEVPNELNDQFIYKLGLAYGVYLKPKTVVIGYDIRPSSKGFAETLSESLRSLGIDVYDIGLSGSEEVYFHTFSKDFDGGVMITASHNPSNYNGLKFVREKSIPIGEDTGLKDIKALMEKEEFPTSENKGKVISNHDKTEYINHLIEYVDNSKLKPLKIVANAGNGCAGPIVELLQKHLPFEIILINGEPDGTFPNGIPNPLLIENRAATAEAVRAHGADLGIGWDGDFDRGFFFDEKGDYIEGSYIVSLLAEYSLMENPGETIVFEPRVVWCTQDAVDKNGGKAVISKSGHSFIKAKMREVDAIYGGEISAHHYFRNFSYCDSGMIVWLLVAQILCMKNKPASEIFEKMFLDYPTSGEINTKLGDNAQEKIAEVVEKYSKLTDKKVDTIDGYSFDLGNVRINIRTSNTEPLVRLNAESRGDKKAMDDVVQDILSILRS